jgi:hypothetical protein
MESRFERVCRIVSLLLVVFAVGAMFAPTGSHLLGASAMAQVVGGNLFCGFVAGFSAGLAVGAVVSGFTCVLCDVGAAVGGLIDVGCYMFS